MKVVQSVLVAIFKAADNPEPLFQDHRGTLIQSGSFQTSCLILWFISW